MNIFDTDSMNFFISLFVGVVGCIISFVMYRVSNRTENNQIKIKYDIGKIMSVKLEKKKEKLDDEEKLELEENYLYKLLELHHNQALQQSNIQFLFSIFAAILGFVLIIIIIIFDQGEIWYENIIKATPGAIIEVVSVLFISQARETRDRATNFFMELNYDKKIEKSIEIAESIERDEIEANVKAKIALHIIGIKEKVDNK